MKFSLKHRIVIQVAATVMLVAFFIYSMDLNLFGSQLKNLHTGKFILLFLLLIPGFYIRAFRWQMLFNNQNTFISLRDSTELLFAGLGLNLFLPAGSGDVAKSFFGYKWSGIKERMLSVSLLDKVIALSSVAVLGIPASLYAGKYVYAFLSVLIVMVMTVLVFMPVLVNKSGSVTGILESLTRLAAGKLDFLRVIKELHVRSSKIWYAVFISAAGWLVTYFQLYLAFVCIGAEVDLLYVYSVAPFLTLARLFPFALNGLGTDEAVIYFFFKQAGLTMETTIAAAVIYRIVMLLIPGFAGLWIIFCKKKVQVMRTGNEETS